MKKLLITICLLYFTYSFSQNEIQWDGFYQLQISDFQSPSTKIGNSEINNFIISCGIGYNIAMTNFEFMFTKNFNSKITNTFNRESSSIIAVDEESAKSILNLAQYGFDLSELYARKLRKKIFEEKRTLSDISFLKPIYYENQKKLNELIAKASSETNLGANNDELKEMHEQVLKEIEELSNFCKECKTPKKAK